MEPWFRDFSGMMCPQCGVVSPPALDADYTSFFSGGRWHCSACSKNDSLWNILLSDMLQVNPLRPGVLSLGLAKAVMARDEIYRNKPVQVDFTSWGMPDDAQVLAVYITPHGTGLFPALITNAVSRKAIPHGLNIYPTAIFDEKAAETAQITVLAIWVPASEKPEDGSLNAAVLAFLNDDFRGTIVPANVAVESKLHQVLLCYFSKFSGKKRAEEFLQDGATYSHQLRFLWPSAFQNTSAPKFDEKIMGNLQRLRGLRNDVAHRHGPVDRKEAAESLLSAIFAVRYLDIYGPLLDADEG